MTSEASEAAIYVHFPFCRRKCPYCGFASCAAERADVPHEAYLSAVVTELRWSIGRLARPVHVTSVFLGGGTPSMWEPRCVGRLLEAVDREAHGLASGAEITIECNPNSLDAGRAKEFSTAGVTRMSVGVQATRAHELRFLGRLHDRQRAFAAIAWAREAGVQSVSADLVYGLPGQTINDAVMSAREVVAAGVDHLSAYLLAIEDGTPLGAWVRDGAVRGPSDATQADCFRAVSDEMVASGFEHYEVSNFRKPGHGCRHNEWVWRGGTYLGVGAGAVGCVQQAGGAWVRSRNRAEPSAYMHAMGELGADDARQEDWIEEQEELTGEIRMRERIMLGLRLAEGVDLDEQGERLGVAGWTPERERAVRRLQAAGRVTRTGGRIAIRRQEWVWLDDTTARLL